LFHHLQPIVTGKEKRHLFEDQLENPRVNKFWDRKKKEVVEERKGVHHLVQCWAQQAHKVSPFLCPSFFVSIIVSGSGPRRDLLYLL
jgi:hypothetical protein